MNLENFNLVELNAQEVKEVVGGGGGFWGDVVKTIAIDIIYEGAKALGGAMVNDWNSRSGGSTTASGRYIANCGQI